MVDKNKYTLHDVKLYPLEIYPLFNSKLPITTGIYAIVNTISKKFYIGSASANGKANCKKGFKCRLAKHRLELKTNQHHSPQLQASYNYYVHNKRIDPDNVFEIWILEELPREKCIEVEDHYLKQYKPYYNSAESASSPGLGVVRSKEARLKQSLRLRGHSNTPTKKWVGVSPEGQHIIFENADKFCRDNPEFNLDPGHISKCALGISRTHRNWQFFYYEEYLKMKEFTPTVKNCIAISPEGHCVKFRNASEFSRAYPEYNFNTSSISKCIRGKANHHKGWRFYYEEDYLTTISLSDIAA